MSSETPQGPTLTIRKNGSILVRGDITLLDHEGNVIQPPKNPFALCRCGHSANKPYCDGSHNREGWCDTAPEIAVE